MNRLLILVLGSFTTSLGSGMTAFALATWAYRTQGSASAVALVQLCAFTPIVLLGPLAGVLADRHDRRTMMLLGDGGSALGLLLVLAALSRPSTPLPMVLAGVTASSCLAALTEPALRASVNELVPAEQYAKASSLLQLASASKFLLAPVLAGAVLVRAGVSAVLWLDIASVGVTLACTLYVRHRTASHTDAQTARLLEQLRTAAATLAHTPEVRRAITLAGLLTVVLGSLQVLLPVVLLARYDVEAVGTAQSLAATGLLVGALVVGALRRPVPWRLLTTGITLLAAGLVMVPLAHSLPRLSLCCFTVFGALAACQTGADLVVRTRVPDQQQGRAWGMIGMISQLGYLVAYALAGPLADHGFEPLLREGGPLVPTLGAVVGAGAGRGTALLIATAGLSCLALLPLAASRGLRAVVVRKAPPDQALAPVAEGS
ncbi:enterobactin exporter EntS [Actinomyces bovis]|uniref:Enterobactin exporter EntS n=1 Tax=Actinomyces bovis TaxID=1658 RepID=A0ABY1VN46_9ACTO|nr:MFS transporter [Actinomyces bovis]SPT53524.1 enterobactin exporter EntS [Actinomyces bovis]VEG55469.1 enterobactin exporter EntS [Actinomyces israelii]